jgi:hypothetical protein
VGKSEDTIRLKCLFADKSESKFRFIPSNEISKIRWFEFDERCQINPDCNKAKKYLAHIIQHEVISAPPESHTLINRFGTHLIDNEAVFFDGERLIRSPDRTSELNIILNPLPYKLVIGDYTELQAVTGIMKLVNLAPEVGKTIVSHTLLYLMRQLFVSIGVNPCCILFLVDKSGSGKRLILPL